MKKSFATAALGSLIVLSLACVSLRALHEPAQEKSSLTSTAFVEEEDADTLTADNGLLKRLPASEKCDLVGLYSNSDAPPIQSLIDCASKSIDIEIYEMADEDVLAAVKSAQSRGVSVRILKDPHPVGQRCNPFYDSNGTSSAGRDQFGPSCAKFMKWLGEFKEARGEMRPFNRRVLCGKKKHSCYEHGKMILVDGKFAAVSTGNFNITNLCNLKRGPDHCNRDYTYVSRDREVLRALADIFAADWNGEESSLDQISEIAMRGNVPRKITVSPFSLPPLTDFIGSAQQVLRIQTQYITSENFAQAIMSAKKSHPNLKVEINLMEFCPFGRLTAQKKQSTQDLMQRLEDSGAHVRVFRSAERVHSLKGYLHAKAIVVDASKAWIGSVNGSDLSLSENREFGIFFNNIARVQGLSAQLHSDYVDEKAEDWQTNLGRCSVKGELSTEENEL